MKREIKFRFRNKHTGKIVDPSEYYGMLVVNDGAINGDGWECDWIIEQYTGLKDKNGIEIYEGDIVTGEYHNLSVDYSKKSAVEWGETYDSDGWCCGSTVGWVTSEGSSLLDLANHKGCEIIGNIHENKDLLS